MQATIQIKVNDTAMVLNNVKEGSNVEVDLKPTAQQAPAAASVRLRQISHVDRFYRPPVDSHSPSALLVLRIESFLVRVSRACASCGALDAVGHAQLFGAVTRDWL